MPPDIATAGDQTGSAQDHAPTPRLDSKQALSVQEGRTPNRTREGAIDGFPSQDQICATGRTSRQRALPVDQHS